MTNTMKRCGFKHTLMLLLLTMSQATYAQIPPNDTPWQVLSKGTATWLFMDIYHAELSGTAPLEADFLTNQNPLKLELCYLKPITQDIFVRGAQEVLPKNLSPEEQTAVNQLHASYQDVKPQDCYQLIYQTGFTQLRLNQKVVFQTNLKSFKQIYFGIWLGPNPLSKDLKQALLGTRS
ncbi:MAG: chalcone isomerase family protein [Thiotrichales bacterium]|nr:chalcone isomerase family protein [Thiotrichales bacterium]